jgi:hypothetical protein
LTGGRQPGQTGGNQSVDRGVVDLDADASQGRGVRRSDRVVQLLPVDAGILR